MLKILINNYLKLLVLRALAVFDAENTLDNPQKVVPVASTVKIGKSFNYSAPAMSLTVVRIKTKK